MRFATLLLALPLMAQQSLFIVGLSASPSTHPQPSGFITFAQQINEANQLYSYSETDFTSSHDHKAVQTSLRTGAATPLRDYGKVSLWAIADGGVATVGTASGGAFSAGMLVVYRSKGGYLMAGWQRLVSSVAQTQDIARIGWGWGK